MEELMTTRRQSLTRQATNKGVIKDKLTFFCSNSECNNGCGGGKDNAQIFASYAIEFGLAHKASRVMRASKSYFIDTLDGASDGVRAGNTVGSRNEHNINHNDDIYFHLLEQFRATANDSMSHLLLLSGFTATWSYRESLGF